MQRIIGVYRAWKEDLMARRRIVDAFVVEAESYDDAVALASGCPRRWPASWTTTAWP